jgi:hypothetical protein
MPNNLPRIALVHGSKVLLLFFFSKVHRAMIALFSRVEYRALEGFVLAVSPFNFTAIGGNLPGSTSFFSTSIDN